MYDPREVIVESIYQAQEIREERESKRLNEGVEMNLYRDLNENLLDFTPKSNALKKMNGGINV